MRNCILFTTIFIFVLFVNSALLSFDLLYAEQPMIYAANQSLLSWHDFLKVYWQPQMLDVFSIPFFRPSGHFLMYQLLTPFLGWHQTQAFIAVNLFFLAASGYLFLKNYALLFPGFSVGGSLAFGFYLMHPALILSRLLALHFEFAHVFFVLLSFYCFARFCQEENKGRPPVFLLGALFFYFVAGTFKEPALLLGPVLMVYYCLQGPRGGKITFQVLALLAVATLGLGCYLTLAWPTLSHPLGGVITLREKGAATLELLSQFFGLRLPPPLRALLPQSQLLWREVVFTPTAQLLIWSFFLAALLGPLRRTAHRKSLLFLWLAALFFLILPINWAMGLPWHLNLSLVFFSLSAGYGLECLIKPWVHDQKRFHLLGTGLAVLVGLTALSVNRANVDHIRARKGFALAVARNAVLHPPAIQAKLGPDTLLLVEDSLLQDSYALGNSEYPLFLKQGLDYDELEKTQAFSFLKHQPLYNGYLFKWAYLLPTLREEVYPFAVERLNQVPDAVIYSWLQNLNNLLCLGYDRNAQWRDRTALFKQRLLLEKDRRFLRVNFYELYAAQWLQGKVLYTKRLSLPDPQVCQYECDQNVQCKGFTYESARYHYHSTLKCQFYDSLSRRKAPFCATCIGFVKRSLGT